ncbi:hypothetical protein AOLI_G00297900 [Acnodon oligacanthus]
MLLYLLPLGAPLESFWSSSGSGWCNKPSATSRGSHTTKKSPFKSHYPSAEEEESAGKGRNVCPLLCGRLLGVRTERSVKVEERGRGMYG